MGCKKKACKVDALLSLPTHEAAFPKATSVTTLVVVTLFVPCNGHGLTILCNIYLPGIKCIYPGVYCVCCTRP